jgi:hypothetical protein
MGHVERQIAAHTIYLNRYFILLEKAHQDLVRQPYNRSIRYRIAILEATISLTIDYLERLEEQLKNGAANK